MTTAKSKTLVEKLIDVRKAVGGYIEKKGYNSAQSYKFASEADITSQVYPAFADAGIIFFPESRRVVAVEEYTTAKGGKMFITTTEAKWVATDGVDRIEVMTIGQGTDNGDKGAYKSMAGDKKYAVLQLLGIATGDDPEEVRRDDVEKAEQVKENPELAPLTVEQKQQIAEQAAKVGIDMTTDDGKTALAAIVLLATGKKSSKDLVAGDLPKVMTAITEAQPAEAAA